MSGWLKNSSKNSDKSCRMKLWIWYPCVIVLVVWITSFVSFVVSSQGTSSANSKSKKINTKAKLLPCPLFINFGAS